jgi:hypothetical protein
MELVLALHSQAVSFALHLVQQLHAEQSVGPGDEGELRFLGEVDSEPTA